ncbi:MAG TPA: CpsB/CapC family capsule biosynthesis tyrosine phosphatase [Bdellovibrionota bacterium]|nr:CpsB/CapC family capsule biosynthesis tyrosine phosphatase [Bdellovibrionota bacterium]
MLDVHAHFLPALDDGAKTVGDSVGILRGLSDIGFTHVVATPHFYPGRYTPTAASIREAAEKVREAIRKEGISIEILLGRECLLDYELLSAPERETFPFDWKGKKYQLIELPQITVPKAAATYLETLHAAKILPLLAHAERYNRIIRDPERVQEYIDMGFRIQVDLMSFPKSAHRALRSAAMAFLKADRIDLVATDIHRPSQLPEIRDAVEFLRKECGDERLERLCTLP